MVKTIDVSADSGGDNGFAAEGARASPMEAAKVAEAMTHARCPVCRHDLVPRVVRHRAVYCCLCDHPEEFKPGKWVPVGIELPEPGGVKHEYLLPKPKPKRGVFLKEDR